jgi:hypothetical protein
MIVSWRFLVFLLTAAQIAVAQSVNFTLPETGHLISLTFRHDTDSIDSFRALDINSAGKHFHLTAKSIARIPATSDERHNRGFWIDIPGLKLDPARYFLVGKYGTDSDKHTLLFFVSEAGASDAAGLLVIGFSATGDPYKVLERDYFDVTSFQSTNDDAGFIVGKETLSQVMGGDGFNGSTKPYATTYDPFSVFRVRPESKAAYSLTESRTYNQKHYVWAGPKSREDYAVLYNLPHHPKPVGAPASRVGTLLGADRIPTP